MKRILVINPWNGHACMIPRLHVMRRINSIFGFYGEELADIMANLIDRSAYFFGG